MALTASDIDLGGNSIHVTDVYYGATTPGSVGTKLDSSLITSVGSYTTTVTGVNMNATNGTDIATFVIPTPPAGFTRYYVTGFYVSNASHTLATVYLGLFTAASAGGTAITSGTTSGINLTVTATADKTAANSMPVTLAGGITCLATDTPLYANLVTKESATATADLTLTIQWIP